MNQLLNGCLLESEEKWQKDKALHSHSSEALLEGFFKVVVTGVEYLW